MDKFATLLEEPFVKFAKPKPGKKVPEPTTTSAPPADDSEPAPPSQPSGKKTKQTNSASSVGASSNSITEMQQNLKSCIDQIKANAAPDGKNAATSSANTQALNNFVVNSVMQNAGVSRIPGQDINAQDPANHAAALKSLRDLFNTMQNTGHGSDEVKPDGRWGARTNNALKNLTSYLFAMNQLTKELGTGAKSDISASINIIADNILKTNPGDMNPLPQESAKAPGNAAKINKEMPAILDYIKNVYAPIINDAKMGKYLEGNTNFLSIGKASTDPYALTEDKKKDIQDHPDNYWISVQGFGIRKHNGEPVRTIQLSNFLNADMFTAWYKSLGYTNMDEMPKMMAQVYNAITTGAQRSGK